MRIDELLLGEQPSTWSHPCPRVVQAPPSPSTLRSFCNCLAVSPLYARRCLLEGGNNLRVAVLTELCTHRLNHVRLLPLLLEYALWRGLMAISVYERAYALLDLPDGCTAQSSHATAESYRAREFAQRMRRLVITGELDSVLTELHAETPQLLENHPRLHFRLVRLAITQQLGKAGASRVNLLCEVRLRLAPLCGDDPKLLSSLKRLLLHVMCGSSNGSTAVSVDGAALVDPSRLSSELDRPREIECERATVVAATLYQALADHFEFVDVELVHLVRHLLCTHTNSFRVQMWTDPIGKLVGVHSLKRKGAGTEEDANMQSNVPEETDAEMHAASDGILRDLDSGYMMLRAEDTAFAPLLYYSPSLDPTRSFDFDARQSPELVLSRSSLGDDGDDDRNDDDHDDDDDDDDDDDGPLNEGDIVMLQEVMAFSRPQAIALLLRYGSLDQVLAVLIP